MSFTIAMPQNKKRASVGVFMVEYEQRVANYLAIVNLLAIMPPP